MASYSSNVTGGPLAFRANPPSGTNYGYIPNNTALTVNTLDSSDPYYSYRNEWFKTTYNGKTGYVMARWIAITSGGTAGTVTTVSGSLNIRATPSTSGTISFTVANGSSLRILEGPTNGFYRIGCGSGTGWGSTAFITTGSGGGGGGSGGGTGTATYGKIDNSDFVNIRATPDGTIIGRLYPNDPLVYYDGETYTAGGHDWYRINFDGDAYIQQRYVAEDTSNHTVVTTLFYNAYDAVIYASNHTLTTSDPMAICPDHNTSFGFNSNDCANFVNQCLCAGGLPMFQGWSDNISGISSDWSDDNWQLTNASRCPLIAKGRISEIDYTDVEEGDIIYTYDSSKSVHLRYTHVVIAATSYDASSGTCRIYGHTYNQSFEEKTLTASNCKCYRVTPTIKVEACEKRVILPESGNGATVI